MQLDTKEPILTITQINVKWTTILKKNVPKVLEPIPTNLFCRLEMSSLDTTKTHELIRNN